MNKDSILATTHFARTDLLSYLRGLPALFADVHPDSRSQIGLASLQIGKLLDCHRHELEPLGSEPVPGLHPDEPQTIHQLAAQLKQIGLKLLAGQHRTRTEDRLDRLTAAVENLSDSVCRLRAEFCPECGSKIPRTGVHFCGKGGAL